VITADPAAGPGGPGRPGWREGGGRRGGGRREDSADLRTRYTAGDLSVFTPEELHRFVPQGDGDPQADVSLAWELLYRLEPGLYDRLAGAERLHPGILGWLPRAADRIVEVGAGTGRLTLDLLGRGRQIVAIEPVAAFRQILRRKLAEAGQAGRAQVVPGFLDDLPVARGFADLVVACSVLTPAARHGGDAGLAEMERACRPGGCVAVIWPNNLGWLAAHGYQYVSFPGPMTVDFASHPEAVELAEIFYPEALLEIRRRGCRQVPYELLGINPPRDVSFKVMPG
jgi:SAM-dependent methyltransferase